MFAVVGTFVDFSGDAQTCIAKQQQRVLLTFNLTQAILDRSPAGLIVTPGLLPERTAGILVSLLQKKNLLKGKKIAVVGDGTESTVVKNYVVPALKKAKIPMGQRPCSSEYYRRHHGRGAAARELHREVEDRRRQHDLSVGRPRLGQSSSCRRSRQECRRSR